MIINIVISVIRNLRIPTSPNTNFHVGSPKIIFAPAWSAHWNTEKPPSKLKFTLLPILLRLSLLPWTWIFGNFTLRPFFFGNFTLPDFLPFGIFIFRYFYPSAFCFRQIFFQHSYLSAFLAFGIFSLLLFSLSVFWFSEKFHSALIYFGIFQFRESYFRPHILISN